MGGRARMACAPLALWRGTITNHAAEARSGTNQARGASRWGHHGEASVPSGARPLVAGQGAYEPHLEMEHAKTPRIPRLLDPLASAAGPAGPAPSTPAGC